MLINPFVVRKEKEQKNSTESFSEAVSVVADQIVMKRPELAAGVQMGRIPSRVLEAEIVSTAADMNMLLEEPDIFARKVSDLLFGYGILQPYVNDPEISDILVNDCRTVYIKRFGRKHRVPVDFGSEERLLKYCYRIAAVCGGRLDENCNADAVLTDRKRNMRIVISLKPISVLSPTICIRKPTTGFTLSELVEKKMLTEEQADFLQNAVLNRKTIVVAGRGGSGKTTLLGALIDTVPESERGILIQETYEINPRHPDIINKLIRISDTPGIKDYTLFELTRNALLMSVDRIFIGELKDREAMDFFNAIYTGHRGSMATVHANSASEVVNRLILLMKRSGTDIPVSDLRDMLFASLDIVVYMDDYRVVEIYDLKGGEEVCCR
jgi:pilus assembly protein CpaF